jgi:broad specificity phosphatase PhoE
MRAVETATAVARPHKLHPETDRRLTESGQFPHWTGNCWESIPTLFPGELESYLEDASRTGGREPISDIAARYRAVIDDAVANGHSTIVVVGHQDPVQATRLQLLDRDPGDLRFDPPNHGEVIALVRSADGRWLEKSRWSPEEATS